MQFKSSKYKYITSKVYEPKKKTGFQYEENNYMNYNQYQQQNDRKKKIPIKFGKTRIRWVMKIQSKITKGGIMRTTYDLFSGKSFLLVQT